MLFKATLKEFFRDRAREQVSTKWDPYATAIKMNALFKILVSPIRRAQSNRQPNKLTFTTVPDFRPEKGKTFRQLFKIILRQSIAIQPTSRLISIADSLTIGLVKSTRRLQITLGHCKLTLIVPTVITIEASATIKKGSPKKQSKTSLRPSKSTRQRPIFSVTGPSLTAS